MKKKIIILIAAVLVICLAVALIGRDKPEETTTASTTQGEQLVSINNTPIIENGTKNPDVLVEITMPLSCYDAEKQTDLYGFFNKNTYTRCRVDEKAKTFSITLKSITHDFMLANVGIRTVSTLGSILDSDQYPYIKGLGTYNSDFSEIEFIADEAAFKAAGTGEQLLEYIGSCGIFYQLYTTENQYKCKVILTDEKTGKKITDKTFRYDNSNAGF